MTDLKDKVAIVTGASTLIGQGVVRRFVESGCRVVMADIAVVGAETLAKELGGHARCVKTDITLDADIDACIDFARATFGGVDFLVNLASTYLDGGFATTRSDWLASLNVNLVSGAVFSAKVAPVMAERGGGAIVNFSSISGRTAQPERMTYSAAKAAILQITRNQAMQLHAMGIRVNSVTPGWTWSNIMDQLTGGNRARADEVAAPFHIAGRVADPSEIAAAVVFLCSPEASFITGTDLAVDGGYGAIGPEGMVDAVATLGN